MSAIQKPTPPPVQGQIQSLTNAVKPVMLTLFGRWAEEAGYEDFAEYQARMASEFTNAAPQGFTLSKVTKRPFAIHFAVGDQVGYTIYATAREYGWKRTMKREAA